MTPFKTVYPRKNRICAVTYTTIVYICRLSSMYSASGQHRIYIYLGLVLGASLSLVQCSLPEGSTVCLVFTILVQCSIPEDSTTSMFIINIYFVLKVHINIIISAKNYNITKNTCITGGLICAQCAQQIICLIRSKSSDIIVPQTVCLYGIQHIISSQMP